MCVCVWSPLLKGAFLFVQVLSGWLPTVAIAPVLRIGIRVVLFKACQRRID